MNDPDIRWLQRFDNYKKAFHQLDLGVEQATGRELSDLEKGGLIQSFEYTHELAWLLIKDFYEYQGIAGSIQGSRDAFRLALKRGLINEQVAAAFMSSIQSRNQTVHTYNEETANEIFLKIKGMYHSAFLTLKEALEKEKKAQAL